MNSDRGCEQSQSMHAFHSKFSKQSPALRGLETANSNPEIEPQLFQFFVDIQTAFGSWQAQQ